jgi:hypothetical protein
MSATGVCRANPPTVVFCGWAAQPITNKQMPVTNRFWPGVFDTEWCGAWEAAEPVVNGSNLSAIDLSQLDTEGKA